MGLDEKYNEVKEGSHLVTQNQAECHYTSGCLSCDDLVRALWAMALPPFTLDDHLAVALPNLQRRSRQARALNEGQHIARISGPSRFDRTSGCAHLSSNYVSSLRSLARSAWIIDARRGPCRLSLSIPAYGSLRERGGSRSCRDATTVRA